MCNLSKGVARKAMAEGMSQGMAEGMERGITSSILSSVQSLMETMGFTTEQAMAALKVPDAERQRYLDLLGKQ